ncbi:hypothetical protein JCM8097_005622 [Rhodosporidiobolus ruineniae]
MASGASSSASTAVVPTGGGNDDGQEGADEVKASPFDALPDEVVLLILDAVFDNLPLHTTLLDLVVDHRLFSLAKEVWFSLSSRTTTPFLTSSCGKTCITSFGF